jgi:hypothetical protein
MKRRVLLASNLFVVIWLSVLCDDKHYSVARGYGYGRRRHSFKALTAIAARISRPLRKVVRPLFPPIPRHFLDLGQFYRLLAFRGYMYCTQINL